MIHRFQNNYNQNVTAASEVVEVDSLKVLVVSSGINGETNAEAIVSKVLEELDIVQANLVILWSTPVAMSATSKTLLRRLHTDGSSVEWGPDLVITDASEIHAAADRCNGELMANAG